MHRFFHYYNYKIEWSQTDSTIDIFVKYRKLEKTATSVFLVEYTIYFGREAQKRIAMKDIMRFALRRESGAEVQ